MSGDRRRRQTRLGAAHRSSLKQAGESRTAARTEAAKARELLSGGTVPSSSKKGAARLR
jgi:hypothetical protein